MKAYLIVLGALLLAPAAQASPCTERLASLQARFDKQPHSAVSSPDVAGTAAETTGAKLHHQPTVGAVEGAEAHANASPDSLSAERSAHFQVLMEQAKAAADSGDERECQASANEAEKALAR